METICLYQQLIITENVKYSMNDHLCALVGVPKEPDSPVVTATSCTNAILRWRPPSADNGHRIHHYYIRYRPTGQADWSYIM